MTETSIQILTADLPVVQVNARNGQELLAYTAPAGAWICNWLADRTQDGVVHYFLLSTNEGNSWETTKSFVDVIETKPHPESKFVQLKSGGDWFSVVVGPTISDYGRIGGKKKSTAKSEAAKANGKKGGRPKKEIVVHG